MARIEQVDIGYLYKNVVDERDNLKHFQANAKQQLGSVRTKLNRADDLCHSLVQENDSLSRELGTLRQKFGDTQLCIENFSREKEEIHADLRELKTLLAETEEGNAREKSKMTQEKVLMSMSLERMRHEVSRVTTERDDARRNLTAMEEVLHARIQECDLLKKQKLELMQEVEDKEKDHQGHYMTLSKDKEEIKKGFEAAVQDNMQMKMDLEKARIQCTSAETVNKTLAENKAKMKGEFDQVCGTLSEMKTEYDLYKEEVQHKVKVLEAESAKKASEVQHLQKEKNRAEAVMDDMRKTISSGEDAKEALVRDMEAQKEALQREIEEKQAEISQLISYSKNKEKMLKQSDSLLSSKEKAIEKQQEELEEYKRELADVITEKNDLKERVDKRDVMISEWTSKCSKYETERQELEVRYSNKLRDLMAEFEALKEECRRYSDENKELEDINNKLSGEIGHLKSSLMNLSNNASSMKTDIKEMKENKRKFELECQILKEHNRNLQVKNDELGKTKDIMVQQNEELRIRQEEAAGQLENLQAEHAHLSQVKGQVEEHVSRLMEEVEEGKRCLSDARRKHEVEKSGIQGDLEQVKRKLKATEDDVKLAEAKASKERLQQETEIVALKVKMTSKEQELEKVVSKVGELEQELADEKKAHEVELAERETVTKAEQGNLLAAVPEDMSLFRPVDGSTPLPTSLEAPPIKDIELNDEHREIIEKLQRRWTDVMTERKEIKKAMMNFYRLIDVLVEGKDKLEKEMTAQKSKFEQKIHSLKYEGSEAGSDIVPLTSAGVAMATPATDDIEDPHVVEANLNNILHETTLFEGHIQYMKQQIGAHYSKAEKALDKHKDTMKTITKLPDGKSLVSPPLRSPGLRVTELYGPQVYTGLMGEQGYKTLADKHFQMIKELSDLRTQVATMKAEQSRLNLENQYLKGSEKSSQAATSALLQSLPSSLSSSRSPRTTTPASSSSRAPLRSTVGDSRYRDAIETLKRELNC